MVDWGGRLNQVEIDQSKNNEEKCAMHGEKNKIKINDKMIS